MANLSLQSLDLPDLDGKYPACTFSRIQAKRAIWELVSGCNRSCYYCFATTEYDQDREPHRKMLPLAAIEEAAQKLWQLGYSDLQLTGGELFLRKDMMEVLEVLDSIGFTMAISTNCDYLTAEIVDRIHRLRIRAVNVSLDSHQEQLNDSIRGNGSFRNTINAIGWLMSGQVRLRVTSVLTEHNRRHIDQTSGFLYDLGVRLHTIASLLPNVEPYDEDLVCRLEAQRRKHPDMELVLLRIQTSPGQEPHHWLACSQGSRLTGVYSDGTISPCTLFLGAKGLKANIYKDDLSTIQTALAHIDTQASTYGSAPCLRPQRASLSPLRLVSAP